MGDDLNSQILAAHAAGDQQALVHLYTQAADASEDLDERCFFWTYAYVFALELGHPKTAELQARLASNGRI